MSHPEERTWEEDLEALRAGAQRGLPSQAETARAVQARLARTSREGFMTRFHRALGARPIVPVAIGIVAVALFLLVLPISYERTVGYEVALALPSTEASQGHQIAAEFRKLLQADKCSFNPQGAKGPTVTAQVPVRSRRLVQGLAMGYTQALAMRGIAARSAITPVRQRFAGNVYTAVASEVYSIRVNRDGKTNEQLAQELQAQFEAAGLPGAVVTVTGEGDETTMEMHWTAPPGYTLDGEKRFDITIEGDR